MKHFRRDVHFTDREPVWFAVEYFDSGHLYEGASVAEAEEVFRTAHPHGHAGARLQAIGSLGETVWSERYEF